MTKMTEHSSKGFKAAIIVMFREVNALKINGKLGAPSRETETINKNQMEITELKTRIPIIKNSWGPCKGRMEMKVENSVNLKIDRHYQIGRRQRTI